jgi:short-subunit dehydrogenase
MRQLILATYSTSKAALLSLHESLTAELGLSSPIKTTLVVPGQMYTPLFYGVETPSTFIAPIVEPLDVARQVVKAIENRQGGEIYAPWYVGYMYLHRNAVDIGGL